MKMKKKERINYSGFYKYFDKTYGRELAFLLYNQHIHLRSGNICYDCLYASPINFSNYFFEEDFKDMKDIYKPCSRLEFIEIFKNNCLFEEQKKIEIEEQKKKEEELAVKKISDTINNVLHLENDKKIEITTKDVETIKDFIKKFKND